MGFLVYTYLLLGDFVMRDYITIGCTPADEDCQSVGMPSYNPAEARRECEQFRNLIRQTVGPEIGTARLAIKSFSHDFGSYYEVVCYFDDHDEEAMDYAFHCESCSPTKWNGEGAQRFGYSRTSYGKMPGEDTPSL